MLPAAGADLDSLMDAAGSSLGLGGSGSSIYGSSSSGGGSSSSGSSSTGGDGGAPPAELLLDWKGEPMTINPGDKLPFKFL
jgi:hypothetical protein